MKTREILTGSEKETLALGSALGNLLRPGDVILMEGGLGSGKTQLAKGIVSAAAGVPEKEVVSPTFTLVNTYEGPFPVHHADLYRIEAAEVEGLGIEEAIDSGGALIVEWAEKVTGLADDPLIIVILPGVDENSRKLVLKWKETGSWDERMGSLGSAANDL